MLRVEHDVALASSGWRKNRCGIIAKHSAPTLQRKVTIDASEPSSRLKMMGWALVEDEKLRDGIGHVLPCGSGWNG